MIHIRKEEKWMNRDKGSYQIPHIYDKSFAASKNRPKEDSNVYQNVNKSVNGGCNSTNVYRTSDYFYGSFTVYHYNARVCAERWKDMLLVCCRDRPS